MKLAFLMVFLLAVAPVVQSAEAVKLSSAEKKELMDGAKAVQRAYDDGDAETIVRLTHPIAHRHFKSRDQFVAVTKKGLNLLRDQVTVEKTDWKEPYPVHTSGAEEVTFVPKINIMRSQGIRVRAESFLVAARKKGTRDWTFLDSAPLKRTPALLWEWFPGLPKGIETPPQRSDIIK
jgi:hypothetical protein